MRLVHTAPLAAAILLAACGGDADTNEDGAVSGEEVAAETAGMVQPQPGQYRVSLELLDFQAPGVPEAGKQQMRDLFASGLAEGNTFCMTPEDAKANGAEEMVKNLAEADCTMGKFDASGGTVVAEMQCAGEQGGTRTIKLDGEMTPDSSIMTMETSQDIPGVGATSMKIRVNSQRVGDCAA